MALLSKLIYIFGGLMYYIIAYAEYTHDGKMYSIIFLMIIGSILIIGSIMWFFDECRLGLHDKKIKW